MSIFGAAAPGSRPAQTPQSAQVDTLLARWVQPGTPGAAVLVMQGDRIVYEKGYGLIDLTTREPITARTVFDIASLSKPFTSMAVLMLIDAGRLQYSDTLGAFFPEFGPEARRITIKELMSHTSGIPDYTLTWGETQPLRDGTARTSENAVRFLARQHLRFEPGTRWEYSNSNYVLLAQIVSKVSGASFPQYLREHIFAPLGMNDSFVYERGHIGARATGYVSRGNAFAPAARNSQNEVYGDGQVNSTIADLARWLRALSENTLVGPRRLEEAFTPARTQDGTAVPYGLGWGLGRYRGLNDVGHGGETDGFAAQLTYFPQEDLSVIVLSNNEQIPAPFAIANNIAGIYLADKVRAVAGSSAVAARPQEYVGKYGLYDLVLTIANENAALWLASSGRKRTKLVPAGDDEFLIDGTDGASSLKFGRNARGIVTCLSLLDQNGTTLWKSAK